VVASPVWPEFDQTVHAVGIFFWNVFLLHPSIRNLEQSVIKAIQDNLVLTHYWEISFHGADESLSILFGCHDRRFSPTGASKEGRLLHPALELLVPGVGANVV